MSIFDFTSYKQFLREKLHSMPKRGHGQLRKIAELLGVHTTMVTHVFRGKANLSVEQALKVSAYLGLSGMERDFFITLVHLEKASSPTSREYFEKQLESQRQRSLTISANLNMKKTLSEKDQAVFYSRWHYSAIRLLTAIEGLQEPHALAAKLGIEAEKVHQALRFLVQAGLCKEEGGKFTVGIADTFVGTDSPLLPRHLTNWRMRAIQQLEDATEEDLFFSNPVVVSHKDFHKIRERLVAFLKEFRSVAGPSPSEELCSLNIDWFRVAGR